MVTEPTAGPTGAAEGRKKAAVYCEACDAWVGVDDNDGRVSCECGRSFVVTITPLPRTT